MMDEPKNQIPESEYRYVFEEGFMEPLSGKPLDYMQKAEAYRLSVKKDTEKHGGTWNGWNHNTCIPIKQYVSKEEQKVKAYEQRRKMYELHKDEEKYGLKFEDYMSLTYEDRQELEKLWNLRRPKIYIKANKGTFYI